MRILHLVGSIDPAVGGPTEAIRMLIAHRPDGFHAEVATANGDDAKFLSEFDFKIHTLGRHGHKWFAPKLFDWLRRHRDEFDGVVIHGMWEFTNVAALLLIVGRVPYIVFPHGMMDPYFKHKFPLKHIKKSVFWWLFSYWLLRGAERVMFTAQLEAELAQQTFWPRRWTPMVVAYGADPRPSSEESSRAAMRAQLPAIAGKRYVLYIGRIDAKKGCDMLMDAFTQVALLDPELHLVMAGPDPHDWKHDLVERLPEELRHRVHWPGMLRGDAKWGAFYKSECFILPSHQENFGIAVAEALSFGKPVLISDKINIAPDLLADGCALVEEDTVEGTRRLLTRWIQMSPDERAVMSRNARECFARRYNMQTNARRVLELFLKFKERRGLPLPAGYDDADAGGSIA